MDHARRDFRKLDGAYMDGLDEKLAIFRCLSRTSQQTVLVLLPPYLFERLILSLLQLLLEEHDDLFYVSARGHVQHDAQGLPADLQIGAATSQIESDR
jgi:hypothetical protein